MTRRWRPRRYQPTASSATRFVASAAFLALGGLVVVSIALHGPASTPVGGASPSPTMGFRPTGSMHEAREWVTSTTLLDGRVLVVGGWEWYPSQATVELWDPATETFSLAGTLPEAREGQTATLLPDGRVLVVGGKKYKGVPLATAELWDPATMSFSPAGTLAGARWGHQAALLPDGQVVVIGGINGPDTAELWDPVTKSFSPAGTPSQWASVFTPLVPVDEGGCATETRLSDGRALVTGGARPGGTSTELWDPTTSTYTPAGTPGVIRCSHGAALLRDGRVLVVGGTMPRGVLSSAEIWQP